MTGRVGMDAVVVRQAATAIDATAGDIDRVTGTVDGLVARIGGSWSGDAAGQFHEAWARSHRPALQDLGAALHRFAALARTNADAQDGASSASGAGGPGLDGIRSVTGTVNFFSGLVEGHHWPDVGRYPKSWEKVLGHTPSSWEDFLRYKKSSVLHWMNDLQHAGGPVSHALDGLRPFAHGVGSVLTPLGLGFDAWDLRSDLLSGDRLGAGLDGLTLVADGLKNRPTPVSYLGGVAIQSWVQAGRAARGVDWSSEGMSEILHASPRDWAGAFGDALKQMPGQLTTIF